MPKWEDINLIRNCTFKNRLAGQTAAEDVVDTSTGEILAEAGKPITKEQAIAIQNAAIPLCLGADRREKGESPFPT